MSIEQLLAFIVIGFFVFMMVRVLKPAGADSFGMNYKYSFYGGGTGIAISPERCIVKLKEKSMEKEYPFEMIRSWESNLQVGGFAVGSGINVASHNLGQSMANKRASGLFVHTKDIENTTWRIAMLDKREQAKWMEILQQCINEGQIGQHKRGTDQAR